MRKPAPVFASNGPVRTCLGCGEKRSKTDLLRFVAREGVLAADPEQRFPGRGVYSCPRPACLRRLAARRDRLVRSLRQEIGGCEVVFALLDEIG